MPSPAREASVLHCDLDAFFAAVEQRDKPSLRGKPVVVGGLGGRGVVSTASYEARVYGARSAMPAAEARRRCPPGTAFLGGRFEAYRVSSGVVMDVLREVSPVLEQVSVDEAYLDLAAGAGLDRSVDGLQRLGAELGERVRDATGGLTASFGIATSKMLAKIGSEMGKPAGLSVIEPGTETDVLHPMSVRAVAGVGPATASRLHAFGVETVGDLARVSLTDLIAIFGQAHGTGLHQLAQAKDDRVVSPERETKSISVEETFEVDVADRTVLDGELRRLVQRLAARLGRSAVFGRTVTVKARQHDFTTMTRSATLPYATGEVSVLLRQASRLLAVVDVSSGLRLLGVAVSGLTAHAQEELALGADQLPLLEPAGHDVGGSSTEPSQPPPDAPGGSSPGLAHRRDGWSTGQDVRHTEHGPGWVWGAGRGRVTVRFEGPLTAPGPIRTVAEDDPELQPADPPDWRGSTEQAC